MIAPPARRASRVGRLRSLQGSPAATGEFQHVTITAAGLARTAELVRAYADLPLGVVDASVIAVAERLQLTDVATLDRRHFTVVRPNHTAALNLLP